MHKIGKMQSGGGQSFDKKGECQINRVKTGGSGGFYQRTKIPSENAVAPSLVEASLLVVRELLKEAARPSFSQPLAKAGGASSQGEAPAAPAAGRTVTPSGSSRLLNDNKNNNNKRQHKNIISLTPPTCCFTESIVQSQLLLDVSNS